MNGLQIRLNAIGGAILDTYIYPATPTIAARALQMVVVLQ